MDSDFRNIETGKTRLSNKKKLIIILCCLIPVILVAIIVPLVLFFKKNKDDNKKPIPTYYSRKVVPLQKWNFYKNLTQLSDNIDKINFSEILANSYEVNVPHTWNNYDGQDGGNNYSKIPCSYQMFLNMTKEEISNLSNQKVYIEFCGSHLKTTLYIDGNKINSHIGGFAKFRFDITKQLQISNSQSHLITVVVDNTNNQEYYPCDADFTFFGGMYRNVNLIYVYKTSFSMEDHGSNSLYVKPNPETGEINVNATFSNKDDQTPFKIQYTIFDGSGDAIFHHITDELTPTTDVNVLQTKISNHHLWNGRKDPYLYHLKAELMVNIGQVGYMIVDQIETNFGFRTMVVNYDGFFLNGAKYQLRGVSRHQDRPNKGWAVTNEEEKEDFDLIYELGANAVRLSHYQQNETVYDYCDRTGLIIICEVPYITMHINTTISEENIIQQLNEMIKQNFNHPSVALWGVMNEVSTYKESDEELNLARRLYNISKSLDPSRQVYGANVFLTPFTSPLNQLTDVVGYNLYGGWYVGDVHGNRWQIEEIKKVSGNRPLCLTEYGADAVLKYHSDEPINHDYTEEYQLYFHQEFYKIIQDEDLWGSFVWNMFDFASDRREEGGVSGMNNKGLVSYDRKTKKESFYFYKSVWNVDEKFVHVCGKRFRDRATNDINVTIFVSQKLLNNDLLIYLNDKLIQKVEKNNKNSVVVRIVLNNGLNVVKAVVDDIQDSVEFEKVDSPNPEYVFLNMTEINNRYPRPEGNFSIYDTIGDIHENAEAWAALSAIFPESSMEAMMHFIENVRLIDLLISVAMNDENVHWLLVNKLKNIPKITRIGKISQLY